MRWRRRVGSTKGELHFLRTEAIKVLQGWGLTASILLFELDVALCELLSNAAEHGNLWQEDKKVSLNMRYYPKTGQVLVLVCDEGQKTIKKTCQKENLSERGRGLVLLGVLTDQCRTGCGRVWIRKEVVHEQEDSSC